MSSFAQTPTPLDSSDFVIANIHEGMDSIEVWNLLGAPDSVMVGDDYTELDYNGLAIELGYKSLIVGATITSKRFPTKRGIKVGDPTELVVRNYGKPDSSWLAVGSWVYIDPGGEHHELLFDIENGHVVAIVLGRILD